MIEVKINRKEDILKIKRIKKMIWKMNIKIKMKEFVKKKEES